MKSQVRCGITPAKKMILVDPSLCRGCDACEFACSLYREGECSYALSRISVRKDFVLGKFEPNLCTQCKTAECMIACPVDGAIYIDERTGARVVDEDKCIGCGGCVSACPFDAIKLNPRRNVSMKCDLCNGEPRCVEVCPTGALRYEDWKPTRQEEHASSFTMNTGSKGTHRTYAC